MAAPRARAQDQAQGEREAGVALLVHNGANQRIWNLVNKGQAYIDVLHKPFVRELIGHALTPVSISPRVVIADFD